MSAWNADLLVADSEAIGKIWKSKFSVDSCFIPYGASVLEDLSSHRVEALGLRPGAYALVVARLTPENNVDLFLDALEAIPKTERPTAVVVGSASAPSTIEARLQRAAAQGDVHWLGHLDDQNLLHELWANCGTYVHGHSVGGTNPALLQALGCGAPTLAFDTPYNREVLGDTAEQQVFGDSPTMLSKRIVELIADRSAQEQFRARGREIVRSRYSWGNVSEAYLNALMAAIKQRTAASGRHSR
jgi:glycosyltransferase involved in cell wall biosynthesis